MKKVKTMSDFQGFISPDPPPHQTTHNHRPFLPQVVKTLRRTQSHARELGHGLGSSTTPCSLQTPTPSPPSTGGGHFGRLGFALLQRWLSHKEEMQGSSGAEEEEDHGQQSHHQQRHQRRGHHYHHHWSHHHHTGDHSLHGHSLASVELASWTAARGANRRGSAFVLPFTSFSSSSSLSPGESAKNVESLESVQAAIVKLFQRKPLREHELGTLQGTIRTLSEAEAGSLIYEYYKDQLLKKGMVILREKIKNEQGTELLTMLGETWDYFFRQIMPSLQALMYPLAEVMKDIDIRNTTLLEFRNIVVLKVGLKDAVESKKYQVPASVRQMLLVLQGLRDPTFLSKEQLDLEKMAACVIVPFMGTRGLYQGAPDPVTKATYRPPMPHLPHPLSKPDITISGCEDRPRLGGSPPRYYPSGLVTSTHLHLHRMEQQHHPIASPAAMRKRHPPFSSPPTTPRGEDFGGGGSSAATMPRLKPVIEVVHDVTMGRRHSVVGT